MVNQSLDLTEWHQSLAQALGEADELFRHPQATPHEQQKIANIALAKTVIAISELPGMKDRIGPLFALLFAYQALADTGKSDPLFANYVKTKGGRELAMANYVVQGRSAAFVELMIEAGWKELEAAKAVTAVLVQAGVLGRRGKPITISTLRQWRANAHSGDYPEVTKHMNAGRENLRTTFRETTGRWPPSKEEIAVIVGGIPDIQIFRDFAAAASRSITTE